MTVSDTPIPLSPQYIWWLAILATIGLVLMWSTFWLAVIRRGESIRETLITPAFFRVVAVMGVIAATVVLSLAGRLHSGVARKLFAFPPECRAF